MSSFALILPAAGKSVRYGTGGSKLLERLHGKPVLVRALAPFLEHPDLVAIIIPTGDQAGMRAVVENALGGVDARVRFCPGGDCRAASVCAALDCVPPGVDWLAIHDAARPLISRTLIDATLTAAARYGAAVPTLPAALTIKQATGPLPAKVERTLPRHTLWAMQTPQVMRRADLLDAFARCPIPLEQVTDDVQLLELAGYPVWLIPGEERNLKITTAIDLHVATLWLTPPPPVE